MELLTTPAKSSASLRANGQYSLIMLKPDCLERELVDEIITLIKQHIHVVVQKRFAAGEDEVFRHYASLIRRLGEPGKQQLRQIYEGKEVIVLLVYGEDAVSRMRALLGNGNPAEAGPETIRGKYGADSFARARKEGRLVDNLIHASDSAEEASREFRIWFKDDIERYARR